jgi:hypothetical protein
VKWRGDRAKGFSLFAEEMNEVRGLVCMLLEWRENLVRCWQERTRECEWNGDSCTKREGHVREGGMEGVEIFFVLINHKSIVKIYLCSLDLIKFTNFHTIHFNLMI